MPSGRFRLGSKEFTWSVRRRSSVKRRPVVDVFNQPPYRLHIGPGAGWRKPDGSWLTVDIDPSRGDICGNFNKDFSGFPLEDRSVVAIYASHVFEHISIYRIRIVLTECYRVLDVGGVLRIVVPDPVTSMRHYLDGDTTFPLFQRRIERAAKVDGTNYTLFEALREDFISRTGQPELLGEALAHQNAWDYASLCADLERAGFDPAKVIQSQFRTSQCTDFAFEGTYPSEANQADRSLYVEATK